MQNNEMDFQLLKFNGGDFRVKLIDGYPNLVATDVCSILGIKDTSDAVKSLPDNEKGTVTIRTPGGVQEVLTVNEPGLYRLIFRSRKPEAEAFKNWVFHEVLPSIRKTGMYISTPQAAIEFGKRLMPIEYDRKKIEQEMGLSMADARKYIRVARVYRADDPVINNIEVPALVILAGDDVPEEARAEVYRRAMKGEITNSTFANHIIKSKRDEVLPPKIKARRSKMRLLQRRLRNVADNVEVDKLDSIRIVVVNEVEEVLA